MKKEKSISEIFITIMGVVLVFAVLGVVIFIAEYYKPENNFEPEVKEVYIRDVAIDIVDNKPYYYAIVDGYVYRIDEYTYHRVEAGFYTNILEKHKDGIWRIYKYETD